MTKVQTENLLTQINTALADRKGQIRDRRKRLLKADGRETAEALERDIITLNADVDLLKIQQKALKRGIVPDELADKEESV